MNKEQRLTVSEYIKETLNMQVQFEELLAKKDESLTTIAYNLFDAIECRLGDIRMWKTAGLTENDLIPKTPSRVLIPSFERLDK